MGLEWRQWTAAAAAGVQVEVEPAEEVAAA